MDQQYTQMLVMAEYKEAKALRNGAEVEATGHAIEIMLVSNDIVNNDGGAIGAETDLLPHEISSGTHENIQGDLV